MQLHVHIFDGGIDHEPGESEEVSQRDERGAKTNEVRREGENHAHHCTGHIGRDGVQVRLDGGEAETLHDLREKQIDSLNGNTRADFQTQKDIGAGMAEDADRIAEAKRFIDDCTGIDLDAMEGQRFLLLSEELCLGCAAGKIPVCEDGEKDCHAALDDEEVSPVRNVGVFDLEDAKCDEAGKCVGDV